MSVMLRIATLVILDTRILNVAAENCGPIRLRSAMYSAPTEFTDHALLEYKRLRGVQGRDVMIESHFLGGLTATDDEITNSFQFSDFVLSKSSKFTSLADADNNLAFFPWFAGALDIVFNLPGVDNLTLPAALLPAIWSGKINTWDHPSITSVNPDISLPKKDIFVLARSDNGGDTEIFTSALSDFSPEWQTSFGSFISPRFANGKCCNDSRSWPKNVINMYANRVLGMLGVTASIPYSIGYAADANVRHARIEPAHLINAHGRKTDPSAESVKEAIEFYDKQPHENQFFSLNNAKSPGAYPMASFSYIIINKTRIRNVDCCQVRELVGFIEQLASMKQSVYTEHGLVGISNEMYQSIVLDELKTLTCEGDNNAYKLYQASIPKPNTLGTRQIMLIVAGIFIFTWMMIGLLFLYQRHLRYTEVDSLWIIPEKSLITLGDEGEEKFTMGTNSKGTSFVKAYLGEEPIMLTNINLENARGRAKKAKDFLKLARNKLIHDNLVKFIGVTSFVGQQRLAYAYPTRGSVHTILKSTKVNMSNEIRIGIVHNCLQGLSYLHKYNVYHGQINSATCYFDWNWTVKIGQWVDLHLCACERNKEAIAETLKVPFDDYTDPLVLLRMIYLDPRADSDTIIDYTWDIYSIGLLIYEIIAMKPAYVAEMPIKQLLKFLTEKFETKSTPKMPKMDQAHSKVSSIIRRCLGSIGFVPTAADLEKEVERVNPCKTGIVDSMMKSMEEYMQGLEAKVAARTANLMEVTDRMKGLLYEVLPPQIADKMINNQLVEPEIFDSVTVYFSDIVGFTTLCAMSTPLQVMAFLNDLWQSFDSTIEKFDAYKVDTIGDAYMVCSGLPTRNGTQHVVEIANLSMALLKLVRQFKIEHLPGKQLRIRVGINTGSVTTGIVGFKMPQYCVFGDAVNTASRMESTSEPMRIQLTEHTEELLQGKYPGQFTTVLRGQVTVKGKGHMRTYWLLERDSHSHTSSTQDTILPGSPE